MILAVAAPALSTTDAPLRGDEHWCGDGSASTDRPDTVGGPQVHVVYAVPSDQPNAFASRASAIVGDLAAVDRWWRREDSAHTLRFDLAAFAGCDSELGRLDLSEVRLPHDFAFYAAAPYRPIFDDLRGEPFGFDDEDKLYLVYFDGPVDERAHCGIGTVVSASRARRRARPPGTPGRTSSSPPSKESGAASSAGVGPARPTRSACSTSTGRRRSPPPSPRSSA